MSSPAGPPLRSLGPFDEVMAEIQREVRRRRANGDFPPSLERRLDQR